MGEWVGVILFDPVVEHKLRNKHNLTPEAVREAVSLGQHTWAGWHDHPEYGSRLILKGSDAESPMTVLLRPVDPVDGTWECLTAWRT